MEALAKEITKKACDFMSDMQVNIDKGNKAAGARARKASLELEKLFKEYRKKSIEAEKK